MTGAHDHGLAFDLERLLSRRRALGWLGTSFAAAGVGGCELFPGAEADTIAKGADGQECVVHPHETEGPFPADGSNRAHGTLANVLTESGIVRQDMRSSVAGMEATADGVELRLSLTLVGVEASCVPLAGHAIYLWHCDGRGRYSIYDLPNISYLRAVGVSDAQGKLAFTTIVPGCYAGRYPHIHFEVYPSLSKATDTRNRLLTSQLAIPAGACNDVYARHPVYQQSIANLAKSPLVRDMVFRDNTPKQLAAQTVAMSREGDGRYRGSVTIGIKTGVR